MHNSNEENKNNIQFESDNESNNESNNESEITDFNNIIDLNYKFNQRFGNESKKNKKQR